MTVLAPLPAGAGVADPLRFDELSLDVHIAGRWTPVVTDVSFSVRAGQIVGLVGESGSGKSITCLAAMGLLPRRALRVRSGQVWHSGRDLLTLPQRQLEDVRGRSIGLIPQEPLASLNPAFTVGDQLGEVFRRHQQVSRREAKRRAIALLDDVGIAQAANRFDEYPHHFSGGMCQRVLVAMALACDPAVVIADEPTTALDVTVQAQILSLIQTMVSERDTAVLLVTHDMGVVADLCDRIVVMYAGEIVESGHADSIFAQPRNPYTAQLLAATPRMREADELREAELTFIAGSMPRPGALPLGCRFGPRCEHHLPVCDTGPVALRATGAGESRCVRVEELTLPGTTRLR